MTLERVEKLGKWCESFKNYNDWHKICRQYDPCVDKCKEGRVIIVNNSSGQLKTAYNVADGKELPSKVETLYIETTGDDVKVKNLDRLDNLRRVSWMDQDIMDMDQDVIHVGVSVNPDRHIPLDVLQEILKNPFIEKLEIGNLQDLGKFKSKYYSTPEEKRKFKRYGSNLPFCDDDNPLKLMRGGRDKEYVERRFSGDTNIFHPFTTFDFQPSQIWSSYSDSRYYWIGKKYNKDEIERLRECNRKGKIVFKKITVDMDKNVHVD